MARNRPVEMIRTIFRSKFIKDINTRSATLVLSVNVKDFNLSNVQWV